MRLQLALERTDEPAERVPSPFCAASSSSRSRADDPLGEVVVPESVIANTLSSASRRSFLVDLIGTSAF